ncbi:MAG TPA: pyrroloquinoline quinone biosynthesis peptide chaperone PqqD [Planctomycetota bacterium]|nr:pyrroloquinoline quinone biosynthesis peptide chaperone PqqD [Planctomycetota bacterium]
MLDAILLAYGAGLPRGEELPPAAPPGDRSVSPGSPVPAAPEEAPGRGARPRLAKKVRFQRDPSRGQATLLYPEGALFLNPTGEAIVRLLDGHSTVPEIASALADRYHTATPVLMEDVLDYLGRLSDRRLIEWSAEKGGSPR